MKVFNDRERLRQDQTIDFEHGNKALRIEREMGFGSVRAAEEIHRGAVVVDSCERESNSNPVRRGGSPVVVEEGIHKVVVAERGEIALRAVEQLCAKPGHCHSRPRVEERRGLAWIRAGAFAGPGMGASHFRGGGELVPRARVSAEPCVPRVANVPSRLSTEQFRRRCRRIANGRHRASEREQMDTSDNGLISRFGRLRGSAAAAFRPFRLIWRSELPDWGRFRPRRCQADTVRLQSQRNRFMLQAMFASAAAAVARAIPIVRILSPMRSFRWAKTCPTLARTDDLRPLAFAVRLPAASCGGCGSPCRSP